MLLLLTGIAGFILTIIGGVQRNWVLLTIGGTILLVALCLGRGWV